ncbi:hypothetical protein R1sor_019314 [Riccia sorocarpa]|uniref:Uncharacterized protein n=1 Tax=Riccia sorocarpa TaxID=122646 RepID=A0ABD3IGF1_9MARC
MDDHCCRDSSLLLDSEVELERNINSILGSPTPFISNLVSPSVHFRKSRVLSRSSLKSCMNPSVSNLAVRSPVRICSQASPRQPPRVLQGSSSLFSALDPGDSLFDAGIGTQHGSLRRAKYATRRGHTSQLVHESAEDHEEFTELVESYATINVAPGRQPPRSLRDKSKWRSGKGHGKIPSLPSCGNRVMYSLLPTSLCTVLAMMTISVVK